MKKVFQNPDMVAHVFASRTQQEGRTSNKNIFFEGNTIYSYGSHFPIATFIKDKKGKEIVLFNDETCSQTTGSHQRAVAGAYSHYTTIEVNTALIKYIVGYTSNSLTKKGHFKQRLKELATNFVNYTLREQLEKASKRRATHLRESDIQKAVDVYNNMVDLLSCYGLKLNKPVHDMVEKSKTDIEEAVSLQDKNDLNLCKNRQAKRNKHKKDLEKRQEKAKKDFIADKEMSLVEQSPLNTLATIYMRIEGGQIRTSHNAYFPVDHAKKAYKYIKECKDNKKLWERNGKTIYLGHFQIDSIQENGDVKAGCHFVEYKEIERIAGVLGLT